MASAGKDENSKKAEEKVEDEVITALYKVNLHCPQCARDIKKPLLTTQGVHSVDVDIEKGEIEVKGVIDVIKIQKLLEKFSKKKVELVSPQLEIKDDGAATEKKVIKENKQPILRTTSIKVHMHCDKCENDLRKKLMKHKGMYSVKTDMKAQTLTVQGTIEPDKLVAYMRKHVHKNAEILTSKLDKKQEKKEEEKEEKKEEKEEEKKEKKQEEKNEEKKEKEKEEQTKEKLKTEAKPGESTEIIEFETEKKVLVKTEGDNNVPYFIHYVYAPQLFSDENPNACFII